jgi:Domain of unknown function (DUF6457)
MNELDRFAAAVCEATGLSPLGDDDQRLVLDLARDVAHEVLRPAAPLSAYLLGVAVGRGAEPSAAAETIRALARDWKASGD